MFRRHFPDRFCRDFAILFVPPLTPLHACLLEHALTRAPDLATQQLFSFFR